MLTNNKAPILKDFSGAAAGFFGNTRTAASLVLGTSLGALFVLSHFSRRSSNATAKTPLELTLIKAYRLLAWSAYILSLNTVITCTVATNSVLHGQFDPLATTASNMLKREFEYEFVWVRWSMLMALLLFVVVVTLRLLLEFNLLSDAARTDTAKFVILSATALLAHLISYINDTLYHWDNVLDMTVDMMRVMVDRYWHHPTPLKAVSMAAACGSLYYGAKTALTTPVIPSSELRNPKED